MTVVADSELGDSGTPVADPPPLEDQETMTRAEIEAEVNAEEIGGITSLPGFADLFPDEQLTLIRYMKRRQRDILEVQRIKDQTNALLSTMQKRIVSRDTHYAVLIENLTKRLLQAQRGKKAKSIKTQFGVVGFRSHGMSIEISDEGRLIAACDKSKIAALKGCLVVKTAVAKSMLNIYFESTGDVPDGCVVKEAGDEFFVR